MQDTISTIGIRKLRESDLELLLEAERAMNSVVDKDFGTELLNPWTLSADDVITLHNQDQDDDGTNEGRVCVAEHCLENGDGLVVGGIGYELTPVAYDVQFVIVHPDSDIGAVLNSLADYIEGHADRSMKRKKVIQHIRDQETAGIRVLLPFWKERGWKCSLARGYFGMDDGWKLVYGKN